MSHAPPQPGGVRFFGRLANQPYLLLSLTSLFWAGNVVLGRYVAGHVPPITLATIRWTGSFLLILPFAWPYLKQDWRTIRNNLPILLTLIGAAGVWSNRRLRAADSSQQLSAA